MENNQNIRERIKYLMGVNPIVEQNIAGLPTLGGLSSSGIFDPFLPKKTYDWVKDWDSHDWLNALELITGIAGSIPSPIAPILLGVSAAAGVVNGISYINEGDKYLGGLYIALSVLPGHELYNVLKNSKKVKQIGIPKVKEAIAAEIKGTATESQKILVRQAAKEIGPEIQIIAKKTQEYVVSQILKSLVNKSLKSLLALASLITKLGWGITKVGIVLGGVFFTYDELFLFFNSKEDRQLAMRNNNSLAQMKDYLLSNEKEIKEKVIKNLDDEKEFIVKNANKFVQISDNTELKKEFLDKLERKKKIEKEVSIEDILGGKSTLKYNDRGKTVEKIQNMLVKLDYDTELSGYGDNPKPIDGIYGKDTFYAIKSFQEDQKIPQTGLTDKVTLEKLIKLSKQKK